MLSRERLAGAATNLVDGALAGRGGALAIVGAAGLGKTWLLSQIRARHGRHVRVTTATGHAREAGLGFGLVLEALRALGEGRGAELAWVSSGDPPAAESLGIVFHRALREVEAACQAGPVALLIDDLHWADDDSLSLFSFLLRRLESLPLAVVVGLRPWPPAAEEAMAGLEGAQHLVVRRLEPLDEADTRELLTRRLGRTMSGEVVARACQASGGNPGLLEQLAVAIERGEPITDAGFPLLRSPHAVLLGRLEGLPDAAIRCIEAAAVLGSPFHVEHVPPVADLDRPSATAGFEALRRSGLVQLVADGMAECTQPLVSQAVHQALEPLVRTELHARAFRLLLDRGLETEAVEHALMARLTGDERAIEALERAGRGALRSGATATAVRCLQTAVQVAGASAPVWLQMALGQALLAAGRGREASALYERLLGRADQTPDVEAEASRMLARALFASGDRALGRLRFREAVQRAQRAGAEATVRALLDRSHAEWMHGGPAGGVELAASARELAGTTDDAELRTRAETSWGFQAYAGGDAAGLEAVGAVAERAAPSEVVDTDAGWQWNPLGRRSLTAKLAEQFGDSEEALELLRAQARRSGSPHDLAALTNHGADLLMRMGRLEEARRLFEEAATAVDLSPGDAPRWQATWATLLLHLDRMDECEEACRRAELIATVMGDWLALLRCWHVDGLRLLSRERLEEAAPLWARLERETERLGIGEPCLVPWGRSAAVSLVRCGLVHDAHRVVEWLERCGSALPCRWPRIAALAGRAALSEAEGDNAKAEAQLVAALELHAEVPAMTLERAETLLHLATVRRRSSRVASSRALLAEALDIASRCGAAELARRAERELARMRARGRQWAEPSLTPAEQRVAELTATGLSRTQVAAQLSISPRTADTHLRRIYRKLGIHSQRELMARGLRPPDPAPPPKPRGPLSW